MGLIHFGGVDSFAVTFKPVPTGTTDVAPLAFVITNLAAETALRVVGGDQGVDATEKAGAFYTPPGRYVVGAVAIQTEVVAQEALSIRITHGFTDDNAISGTDMIENSALTNGGAFVDTINGPIAAARQTVYYEAPQNPGFVDNSSPAVLVSSGFVEAERILTFPDELGVTMEDALGTSLTDITGLLVHVILCRTAGDED